MRTYYIEVTATRGYGKAVVRCKPEFAGLFQGRAPKGYGEHIGAAQEQFEGKAARLLARGFPARVVSDLVEVTEGAA